MKRGAPRKSYFRTFVRSRVYQFHRLFCSCFHCEQLKNPLNRFTNLCHLEFFLFFYWMQFLRCNKAVFLLSKHNECVFYATNKSLTFFLISFLSFLFCRVKVRKFMFYSQRMVLRQKNRCSAYNCISCFCFFRLNFSMHSMITWTNLVSDHSASFWCTLKELEKKQQKNWCNFQPLFIGMKEIHLWLKHFFIFSVDIISILKLKKNSNFFTKFWRKRTFEVTRMKTTEPIKEIFCLKKSKRIVERTNFEIRFCINISTLQ